MAEARFKGTDDYIASPDLQAAVNVAVALERPLLARGEPGTGKTLLAEAVAEALGMPLITWPVKSTTRAQDGLYVYDTVQRLYDSQFGEGDPADVAKYIRLGQLGESFAAPERVVLVIDEVDKADLVDLADIVDVVSERPEKFIVFCDDLSFDDGEPGYKALKSVLDGSVAAAAPNVLIYATSNRRHLLPEYMKENLTYTHTEDGEVHPGEGVEEKISLSERFGLWVSFYPFTQDEYLTIEAQWLDSFGVTPEAIAAARQPSLVWALERGSRSGRIAYQFARDYAGKHATRA